MIPSLALLISALIRVESGGNDHAVGKAGEVGCLQITPAVVEDVNRIQKAIHFTLEDRENRDRSVLMCRIFIEHYATEERLGHEPTVQDMARIWNCGPRGWQRDESLPYWRKVKAEILRGGGFNRPSPSRADELPHRE